MGTARAPFADHRYTIPGNNRNDENRPTRLRLSAGYPWLALGTLLCAIVGTAMVLVFPTVTKRVIDEVLIQRHPERLTPLIAVAALAFLLQQGMDSLQIILNNTFEQRVIFDLRSDLYSHIQMFRSLGRQSRGGDLHRDPRLE